MVITPVNSVNFKNNYASLNFGSRKNNDTEGQEFNPSQRRNTTDLSKMPVVVLLALTPALSEAKVPENNANIIPVTTNYTKPEQDVPTYIIAPEVHETQQTKAPFGWESMKYMNINASYKFFARGEEQNLIFVSQDRKDAAHYIYIFPSSSKGSTNDTKFPPEVTQLVYHNIGKDKEYCGAIVCEDILDINTGKYKGTLKSEIRLTDEAAQKIIDLITGYSKLENKTSVKIKETTNPNLSLPKLYE